MAAQLIYVHNAFHVLHGCGYENPCWGC